MYDLKDDLINFEWSPIFGTLCVPTWNEKVLIAEGFDLLSFMVSDLKDDLIEM